MLKFFSLIPLIFIQIHFVIAQNLIQNGSFELGIPPCEESEPEDFVEHWYSANGYLRYNHLDCIDTQNPNASIPHSEKGSMTISGSTWVNGILSSRMIASTLKEPLEAGEQYYLEIFGKSQGISHVDESSLMDCPIDPPRDIKIFWGTVNDSFKVEYTYGNNVPLNVQYVKDYPTTTLEPPMVIQSWKTNWQLYTACFEATGMEEVIGISGPIRHFNVQLPCIKVTDEQLDIISQDSINTFATNRFFHFFRYEIDDLALHKIPKTLKEEATICQFQNNTINLHELLPDIPIFERAQFLWEDGNTEAIRSITEAGFYQIEVIMPCVNIPMDLEISKDDCPLPVHFPNIFSPNEDGINDIFTPFFNPSYQLNSIELLIFDRWGNLVFETTNSQIGWDGTFSGEASTQGIYLWKLEYQLEGSSQKELLSGDIMLVR